MKIKLKKNSKYLKNITRIYLAIDQYNSNFEKTEFKEIYILEDK